MPQLPNPHMSIEISMGPNRGAESNVAARNDSRHKGPAAHLSLSERHTASTYMSAAGHRMQQISSRV